MNGSAPSLVAFGAAHLDAIATLDQPPRAASVPGRVRTFAGGAAFNAARHVAAAGRTVELHTPGAIEAVRSAAAGVSLRPLGDALHGAPSYSAILDPDGELVVAVADMRAYDELEADVALPQIDAAHVLVDANLPSAVLARLASRLPPVTALHAMAVSPAKARRLLAVAKRIDVLFANAREIEAVASGPRQAAELFRSVVMTDGPRGIHHFAGAAHRHQPAAPREVVDVTGAGDAVAGGFLAARLSGSSIAEALVAGAEAAARTLQVAGPFPFPERR